MTMRTRTSRILLLAILAIPGVVQAQNWTVTTSQMSGGWIGINFEYVKAVVDGRERTVVKILQVAEGSPAEGAGIKAGDILTQVDGQPVSERVFSVLRETLEPGGLVRLTLLQEDGSREVLLRAAEWPETQFVLSSPNMEEMVIKLDTLRGAILASLDSARLSIGGLRSGENPGEFGVQILRIPSSGKPLGEISITYQMNQARFDSLGFHSGTMVISPEAALPFEAWVVGSAATDSLRTNLTKLRRELNLVRGRQQARMNELGAGQQQLTEARLRQDEALATLRQREQELVAQQEQVYQTLRKVSEEEMQRRMVEIQLHQQEAIQAAERSRSGVRTRIREQTERSRTEEPRVTVEQRTLSPVFIGQNVVLGAQVTPMTPSWAEALRVEDGVVVVQVFQGTPAAEAGLKDGDVIVQVAGEDVSTIADLRFGVGAFDGPLTIRVIRKGQPTDVVVRR